MATKRSRRKTAPRRKAYLVESLPLGINLEPLPGVALTGPTLARLARRAKKSIDLTAMYWTLTPDPTRDDEQGFTKVQLIKRFGAQQGQDVYDALAGAAKRGVRIRIVEGPGFANPGDAAPPNAESYDLIQRYPDQVARRTADMGAWYGSGIMHQKIWVFDGKDIYLGSANNDWKSLTQVKEMGIAVENDPSVGEEMTRYFEAWWAWCGMQPKTRVAYDPSVGIERQVPRWSELLPARGRTPNPLDAPARRARGNWERPLPFGPNARWFLSGAPEELCVGDRTWDGDALAQTIRDAEEHVAISVMDFAPVGLYGRGEYDRATRKMVLNGKVATPVWWSLLAEALIYAITTKGVHARLLVSQWAHTSGFIVPYLQALLPLAAAGAANTRLRTGSLEVKLVRIPGWDKTALPCRDGDAPRRFPGHTRVNHTKYIVTDRRLNIGTSNMTYDYFASTAGASFNTDDAALVRKLQAVFDRDWNSRYCTALT